MQSVYFFQIVSVLHSTHAPHPRTQPPPPMGARERSVRKPYIHQKIISKTQSVNTKGRSVNTMTENTKVLGIRLNNEDKEYLSKYLNRESAEALLKQIKKGEIDLTLKGAVFTHVNTISESVNTPDCENCEFAFNALDMSGFDEVCEFKGIDRQEALDKCVQMLWR